MTEFKQAFDIVVENVKRDLREGRYFVNEFGTYVLSDEVSVNATSNGVLCIYLHAKSNEVAKMVEKEQDLKEADKLEEQAKAKRAKWGL